jgi:Holliday junction resolvasome RuvABC DNA-binding subunit
MNKNKILKPIEIQASLRYRCPNEDCGYDHWLFLKEVQTKNFKVVCECGTVFKTKRIKILQTIYDKKQKIKKQMDEIKSVDTMDGSSIVSRAINIMINLGYTRKESSKYIKEEYLKSDTNDVSFLVKKAISKIGGIEEND